MFLSIVSPVYNVGEYLPRFLESLRGQEFQDYEVVFVYDQSNDDSLALIQGFCDEKQFEGRSKIICNKEKKGVGFAKDLGFKSVSPDSRYILFLDSDDQLSPAFLQKMVEKAEETNADIVCCGFQRIDEEKGTVLCEEMTHNPEGILSLEKLPFPLEFINTAAWNKLYKREVAQESSFGLSSHAEDLFYLLGALRRAKTITFINEPLYQYFIHPGSLITTMSHERFSDTCSHFLEFSKKGMGGSLFKLTSSFIFIRIGIGSTLRVWQSVATKREKRLVVREARQYMKDHFAILGRNRYLSFSFLAKAGKKGIAIWILKVLYRLRMFGFAAGVYEKRAKKAKKEIRW